MQDELCLEIQAEADKRTAYGYRRIAESLWKKGNRRATRKRVRGRMLKLGLSRRPKRRKTRTTTPGKGPASPNLAANLNLERLRQLLVTDLTYVALPKGFAYVSVAPERFSGRFEETAAHRLAMNPDTFPGRRDEEILSTFVHKMAHVWQEAHGTPPRRCYHDRQWAEKVKPIGLQPTNTGEPGGKLFGQTVSHYILPGDRYARKDDFHTLKGSV